MCPDVNYFELQIHLTVPLVFIDGKDHIEGFLTVYNVEFFGHVESYAR